MHHLDLYWKQCLINPMQKYECYWWVYFGIFFGLFVRPGTNLEKDFLDVTYVFCIYCIFCFLITNSLFRVAYIYVTFDFDIIMCWYCFNCLVLVILLITNLLFFLLLNSMFFWYYVSLVLLQFNHIISASVNIGLPVNIGRGVNIGCDMFLHRFW